MKISKLKKNLIVFNRIWSQPLIDCINSEFYDINAMRCNLKTKKINSLGINFTILEFDV